MIRALCLLAVLGLSACTTVAPESRVITQEVVKKVAASCVPIDLVLDAPDYGSMKAALLAAPDMAARYQLALKDVVILIDRETAVEPVITACRAAGAAK